MEQITIEKNVPIPAKRSGVGGVGLASTLRAMDIGDSILLPKKAQNGIHRMARLCDVKLVTRLEGESVRVWRTA